MLRVVGRPSLAALVDAAIPVGIREQEPLDLPDAVSEAEVLTALRGIAAGNTVRRQMIGLGYHDTHTPQVVARNVLENPAWYTAYTPYQPEISQGRLEALLNFQTVVADLTGLPVAGASLLDEPTAAAEAMTLLRRARTAHVGPLRRGRRHPPPDAGGAGDPRGAAGHRARRRRPRATGCRPGTSSACCCSHPGSSGARPRPRRRDR